VSVGELFGHANRREQVPVSTPLVNVQSIPLGSLVTVPDPRGKGAPDCSATVRNAQYELRTGQRAARAGAASALGRPPVPDGRRTKASASVAAHRNQAIRRTFT
jgi:hypothetical protein